MTKRFLSLFAILLLLTAPTMIIADETGTVTPTEVPTDFGTDSYDEDGCFL